MVRYTPTRPGEYVLSVFCSGEHIVNSPFTLDVTETVLAKRFQEDEIMIAFNPSRVMYTGSYEIEGVDSTQSVEGEKDLSDDPTDNKIRASGAGLQTGEVGLVSSFQVRTPAGEKGPLSIGITCPALSIPVPSVSTELHATYLQHDVVYLPTEPGVYQIDVSWGDTSIEGSPFYLSVAETTTQKQEETKEESAKNQTRISYYRPTNKHSLIIYYSATTEDSEQRANKQHLETLLREENPLDSLICITMDLELERVGRKKIFEKASTRKLPMVFVNEKYVGSFEDIIALYGEGKLRETLLQCTGDKNDLKCEESTE